MDEQGEGLKRQQLLQRAIMLAVSGFAAGTAVAIPTESDAISPIHLSIGSSGGGGELVIKGGKLRKAAASLQTLPAPSYVNGTTSLIKFILVETDAPVNNQYKIPDAFKPIAYFRFDITPTATKADAFIIYDHSSAKEAFRIDNDDAQSLYIVLCGAA